MPTKEAAEQLELHLRLRRSLGDHYEEPATTLGEEIDSFLAWKTTAASLRRARSKFYERCAVTWKPFRSTACSQLRRNEIEDHVVARAAEARRSSKNELEFLKAVLRRAEERGQRVDLRVLRIEPVRPRAAGGIALTPNELAELASWFPERSKRLVMLAGTVGARQNEFFTLDERQLELDGDEPVMRVPRTLTKSRRPKAIPLTSREALLLKEQLLARSRNVSRLPEQEGRAVGPTSLSRSGVAGCGRSGRV